eukprot:jgi/Galph1/4080/GphlegSOOS_G2761.1
MPLLGNRVIWELNSLSQLVIYYISAQGPLESCKQVYIHVGRDNWNQFIGTFPMLKCEIFFQYVTEEDCQQLDFVFTDGNCKWDNNQGEDWHWHKPPGEFISEAAGCVCKVRNSEYLRLLHPDRFLPRTMVAKKQVAVFWDIENCAVPTSVAGNYVVRKLTKRLEAFGETIWIRAYASMELLKTELKLTLQTSGVELVDAIRDNTPRSSHRNGVHCFGKDAADKLIINDMWLTAWQNMSSDICLVLISGDRDFAYTLSRLSMLGYYTIVIYPRFASRSLVDSASLALPWRNEFYVPPDDISQGLLPRHLPHRQRAVFRSSISHYSFCCQGSRGACPEEMSLITQSEQVEHASSNEAYVKSDGLEACSEQDIHYSNH